MIKRYTFQVEGTAADGQTWVASGEVQCEWGDVFAVSMREAFGQLTQGRAIYGQPGVGCKGPYDITEMRILQVGHG